MWNRRKTDRRNSDNAFSGVADNNNDKASGNNKPDDSMQIKILYYIIEFNANAEIKLIRKRK